MEPECADILRAPRPPSLLHGLPGEPRPLDGKYPRDLIAGKFMGYAGCSVTEGPFVRRRREECSYFETLKAVGSIRDQQERRGLLLESFKVLDYQGFLTGANDSAKGLRDLLFRAEPFLRYPPQTA